MTVEDLQDASLVATEAHASGHTVAELRLVAPVSKGAAAAVPAGSPAPLPAAGSRPAISNGEQRSTSRSAMSAGRRITPEPVERGGGSAAKPWPPAHAARESDAAPLGLAIAAPRAEGGASTNTAAPDLVDPSVTAPEASRAESAAASSGQMGMAMPGLIGDAAVVGVGEEGEAYRLRRVPASQSETPSEGPRPSTGGLQQAGSETAATADRGAPHAPPPLGTAADRHATALPTLNAPSAPQQPAKATPPGAAAAAAAAAAALSSAAALLSGDRARLLSDLDLELKSVQAALAQEQTLPNKVSASAAAVTPHCSGEAGGEADGSAKATVLQLSEVAEVAMYLEGRTAPLSELVAALAAATGAAESAVRAVIAELAARKSYAAKDGERHLGLVYLASASKACPALASVLCQS